jgi:hypothetical protein
MMTFASLDGETPTTRLATIATTKTVGRAFTSADDTRGSFGQQPDAHRHRMTMPGVVAMLRR